MRDRWENLGDKTGAAVVVLVDVAALSTALFMTAQAVHELYGAPAPEPWPVLGAAVAVKLALWAVRRHPAAYAIGRIGG
jgi:hypothetical protein